MPAGLEQRVHDRLDAYLHPFAHEPVAMALSGGGDSRALLAIAARWAKARQRRLIALTVDHRLNPASADWTQKAGLDAALEGIEWHPLIWEHPEGGDGVQARARLARHALLANAARSHGARIILLGHTLDDVAETRWMQADGGNLGDLRPWSPSPVWPEGRSIALLRPLIDERRSDLRAYLQALSCDWIDDPANEDSRYQRVRARKALSQAHEAIAPASSLDGLFWHEGDLAPWGALQFTRQGLLAAPARVLAVALLCASGQVKPPRGDRLESLRVRLASGEDFTAVLAGARLQAHGDDVLVVREHGEMRRSGLEPLMLQPGHSVVWDGRFEICDAQKAGQVVPAHGLMSRFSKADRAILGELPACVRSIVPAILHQGSDQPVLAFNLARLKALPAERFRLNCPVIVGETTQEARLFTAMHGEKGSTALFSV